MSGPEMISSPIPTRRNSVRMHGRQRAFSIQTTSEALSGSLDIIDEQFWLKLIRASEGQESLTQEDAKRVITALREEDELNEERVVLQIVQRLKSKDSGVNVPIDEGFLTFLSENYNQLRSKYVTHAHSTPTTTGASPNKAAFDVSLC